MRFQNRVTELLGVEYPIVQAPMGWIARAQLASAVSNAGGLGIIETSSGELDAVKGEIRKMRELTDKPFGVNIAQAFVRDPDIVSFVVDQGVKFVTTSAGDPTKYTKALKDAGLTVFHVVPTLRGALKAVDAGVDGLVVEGGEGGGFKNPRDVASMVLLPLVRSHVKVPIIAAGGMLDGATMAAAFALGAEGIQMGTRMVSSLESPVHENWKKAVGCGVDGLIVEGGEGGGFKNPRDVASMVLLPLVRSKVDVPIIAAGGFVDGSSMAAAFALGAEGVQMGTRMVSAAESPVHENWKQSIIDAAETDTVFLNRFHSLGLRALRTEKTTRLERDPDANAMVEFATVSDLYFGGDMEASIALTGQVAGRIDEVRPVKEIIDEVAKEFFESVGALSKQYLA